MEVRDSFCSLCLVYAKKVDIKNKYRFIESLNKMFTVIKIKKLRGEKIKFLSTTYDSSISHLTQLIVHTQCTTNSN